MECDVAWQTYDQERLDEQYNASRTVPSLDPYFERYAAESARVRAAHRCTLDVPYGSAERQRLDVFPCAGAGAPVLLFLHGGFWRRMSKDDFSFFAEPFLEAATVVIPSYSLAPAATLDAMVEEMRAVVLWVQSHLPGSHGRGPRIVAAGHSAGGQLAGMLVATDWNARGLRQSPIAAMCGMSGLYDLEPVRRSYVNEWLRIDEESARRNSPILHLRYATVPLVAAVGEHETQEFQRQTFDFATAWRECGRPAECDVMTGLNHYDMPLDVLSAGSRQRAEIIRLLEEARAT